MTNSNQEFELFDLFRRRLPVLVPSRSQRRRIRQHVRAELHRQRSAYKDGPSTGGTKCNRCGGPAEQLAFGLTACKKCGVA